MNDTERKVLKWLYNDIGGRASHVMAYEFLLGDDASRRPDYPYGCHEFNRCLELIRTVPETREAVTKLAAKSRYWAALDRHWEALAAMLSEETGGNMAYPWGDTQNNRRPPGPH